MSQAQNKVNWCINKAKKELSEKKTHRGLTEVSVDIGEVKEHIQKAEHNFKAIIAFENVGFGDWSVSAAFYTIYHCFLAIILKFGYESRNQECTIALIEYLKEQNKIIIDDEIIDTLKTTDNEELHERSTIELRENFQYGTKTKIDDKQLLKLNNLCKKAIEQTKRIIY